MGDGLGFRERVRLVGFGLGFRVLGFRVLGFRDLRFDCFGVLEDCGLSSSEICLVRSVRALEVRCLGLGFTCGEFPLRNL